MQTFRRIVAILTFPAIAWLGAACDRVNTPTEPPSMAVVAGVFQEPLNLIVDNDGMADAATGDCNAATTTPHMTIQSAINAATAGQVIGVCPAALVPFVYAENVDVNVMNLTLLGAQAGQSVATRTFVSPFESKVVGIPTIGDTPVFQITAPGVTIDGFSVRNMIVVNGSAIGIGVKVTGSGAVVKNNIIDGVFTPDVINSSSSAQAIYLQQGPDNVVISGNAMSNIRSDRSAKGVFIGDATGSTNSSDNVQVIGNSISNVTSDSRGAYGVLINRGRPTVVNSGLVIQGNTITTLLGSGVRNASWVHAIGLEANTPYAVVRDNSITALVNSSPDMVAVFFEDNPSYSTGHVNQNNFNVTSFAFGIAVASAISGTAAVDGTCNWWGDPTGPSGPGGSGAGARVSSRVAFVPWLLEPAPSRACRGGSPSGGTVTGGGQIDVMSGVTSGVGSFGFSAKQATHSGHLNYMNHVSKTHLNCTVDIVVILSPNAHLEGMCSSNSYTGRFQADVQDNGNPGKGADNFKITYDNTTIDGATRPIRSGNIEIH
jgi:hypothetical protein